MTNEPKKRSPKRVHLWTIPPLVVVAVAGAYAATFFGFDPPNFVALFFALLGMLVGLEVLFINTLLQSKPVRGLVVGLLCLALGFAAMAATIALDDSLQDRKYQNERIAALDSLPAPDPSRVVQQSDTRKVWASTMAPDEMCAQSNGRPPSERQAFAGKPGVVWVCELRPIDARGAEVLGFVVNAGVDAAAYGISDLRPDERSLLIAEAGTVIPG